MDDQRTNRESNNAKVILQACVVMTFLGAIALVCEGFWKGNYWEIAGGICVFYLVARNYRINT
jgi:hypothetical protein